MSASRNQQIELLAEGVAGLIAYERDGMPSLLLGLKACAVVKLLAILYPDLWVEFGRDLQQHFRNGHGVCSDCGETPIPAVLSHSVSCNACHEKYLASMGEIGIDPYEPNKPEDEEVLVDAQIRSDNLVNNLDDDYVDALARMLGFRKT